MSDQATTTPDDVPLAAALAKPIGWDQVRPDDDCTCPQGGLHQPGCDYHGWDLHEDDMRAERDYDTPADDDPDED